LLPSTGTARLRHPRVGTDAWHVLPHVSASPAPLVDQQAFTGWDDPELNLRVDWNSLLSDDPGLRVTRYSERYFPTNDQFVRYLADFADVLKLRVEYNAQVVHVDRGTNGAFRATDQQGRVHEAKRLIVATGVSQPYIPPIPGIETAELYGEVSVDPS